jgi:addiction module HigA family antidote
MHMYNPPHPGEILHGLWLEPMGISISQAAKALGVSRKTVSKLINKRGSVTPEMAMRLSLALGTSAESWLAHQAAFDLWQLSKQQTKLRVQRLAA